ncbi:DNA-3-methyladenine glycosylase I [Nocardioides yefusunii]|uniref:DNA-3-methyladenine glycosylase I n=1 Tax=Nocardioides yefusunii TaxID=2500546 RepID=A0ABW1QZG2_9ACTN|nr:DNA-3-methyladenine glycosylase I [Nocardioides yefusunii]
MTGQGRVDALAAAPRSVEGDDGLLRCPWASGSAMEREYHDAEWGVALGGESAWFERMTLEGFQAGLSWRTILAKRDAFREVFAGFDVDAVAAFTPADEDRLMSDARIVRNRAKIRAAVVNARATVALREHPHWGRQGGLEALLSSFTPARSVEPQASTTSPESVAMSKALKKLGFTFVGPTTMHALMEATGMFDPHLHDCFRRGAGREQSRGAAPSAEAPLA